MNDLINHSQKKRTSIYHVEDVFKSDRKSAVRPITSDKKKITIKFSNRSSIDEAARTYAAFVKKIRNLSPANKLKSKANIHDSVGMQLESRLPRKLRSKKELEAWTYFGYGNESKGVFDMSDITQKTLFA